MEREALKLALEALEAVNPSLVCDMAHHSKKYQHGIGQTCPLEIRHLETITAIKEALAQPAQEPVARVSGVSTIGPQYRFTVTTIFTDAITKDAS